MHSVLGQRFVRHTKVVAEFAALAVAAIGFVAALVPVSATATTPRSPAAGAPTTNSLYWGAYIGGDPTYNDYYGHERTWGDAPWDLRSWDRFELNAGERVSLLHYGQPPPWEQAFMPDVANMIVQRGAIPFMDLSSREVSLRDITAGAYDHSVVAWGQSVATWGRPMFLRWNWEMNGTWFPWGAQAASRPLDYVESWRHIHDLVSATGADVTWVWCPNTEFATSTPLGDLYPGDEYVDWTCLDAYNWGGTDWVSFEELIRSTYDQILAIAPSKSVMLGEVGSVEEGGSKAAWISDMFASLPSFPSIRGLIWFNERILERGTWQEWPIESSHAAQTAFSKGLDAAHFATNTFSDVAGGPLLPPP